MIVAHTGIAFGAKRLHPRLPVALLLVAAYLPDLLEIGVSGFASKDQVWSHALVIVLSSAVLLGAGWWAITRDARGAWLLAALPLSHWVLDFVSSAKPLWPHERRVGLLLFDRSHLVEGLLELSVIAGVWWATRRSVWPRRFRTSILASALALQILSTGVALWREHHGAIRRQLPRNGNLEPLSRNAVAFQDELHR
jgi:hypothetical protein